MNRKPIMLFACALAQAGCGMLCTQDEGICLDFSYEETGADETWTCTTVEGQKVCTQTPADDPRIESATQDGAFVLLEDESTCDNPSDPWVGLVRQTVFDVTSVEFVQCDATQAKPALCMPEFSGWRREGSIGAVGVLADGEGFHCDQIPDLDLVHDYYGPYSFCPGRIVCMGVATECACECESDWPCDQQANQLEQSFYGTDVLFDLGFELRCTGYPWTFEQGQHFGTSCEVNQDDPYPGEVPNPLEQGGQR